MFEDELIESAHALCDTKVEIKGAYKANWNAETRLRLKRYGLAKTIIVDPCLCLSFAGNDIMLVDSLLSWLESNGPCELNHFISKAFEIHMASGNPDDIEFLILAKENHERPIELISIKEGKISRNCKSAWIGSYKAFERLQELRSKGGFPGQIDVVTFWDAVNTCRDETVGGFPIEVQFLQGRFEYNDFLLSWMSGSQILQPGESARLIGCAENGDFTITSHDHEGEPLLHIVQNGTSVLYTRKYRYLDLDSYSPATKYLLLPVLIDAHTGEVL